MAIVNDAGKRGLAHRAGDGKTRLILSSFYPSFDTLQKKHLGHEVLL
jgi:hypothetical protein